MAVRTKDTVDIVKELVASLTPTVEIFEAIDNGDGTFTLTIFNTYWIHANQQIIIEGNVYTVVSFVINDSITIKEKTAGAGIPTVNSFILQAPHFEHGKPIPAAEKHSVKKLAADRMPFVWLEEILEETINPDFKNRWAVESRPRLYFMDEARSEDWTPEDHKVEILQPMRQMVEYFFELLDKDRKNYKRVVTYSDWARANWGEYVQGKGAVGRFWNDDLSGHEVLFDFGASRQKCDPRLGNVCTIGVEVQTTAETSPGANDGTANAVISGQGGNLSFSWVGPNGYTSTDQNITGLEPGTYTVTVTDDTTARS